MLVMAQHISTTTGKDERCTLASWINTEELPKLGLFSSQDQLHGLMDALLLGTFMSLSVRAF